MLSLSILVPGAINRFPGLNVDNSISGSGSPDDILVRSFDKNGDVEKAEETDFNATTSSTTATTTTTESSVQKRSIQDYIVLSRKGVYRVLESRLSA